MSELNRSRTIVLIKDLMLRSKVKEWQVSSAATLEFAKSAEDAISKLTDGCHLVVDLSLLSQELESFVMKVKELGLDGVRLTGFGSHVDKDLHEGAKVAGFNTVLPRSKFFGDIGKWL